MKTLRTAIFIILILSTIGGLTAVVWQFNQLINHHRLYIVREGMWPTVEQERTILELRDAVVRIALGDMVSADDYTMRRGLAFSRAEIVRGLVDVEPTYSAEQQHLVAQLKQGFDSYALIDGKRPPDQTTAQRLVPVLDSMVLISHDLVNFRRDAAYKVSRETFIYIDKLIGLLVITIGCLFVSSIAFFSTTLKTLRKNAEHEKEMAAIHERTRIAQDLHDVTNHYSAKVIRDLRRVLRHIDTNPAVARLNVEETIAQMKQLQEDTRALSFVLRHGQVQPLGESLRTLAPTDDGLTMDIIVMGTSYHLPDKIAFAAYRIVQEATTNTIKHAPSATKITVNLEYRPDRLVLDIADNGQEVMQPTSPTASGLLGIRERVEELDGEVVCGPTAQGYHIYVELPTTTEPCNESYTGVDRRRQTGVSANGAE